GLTPLSHHGQRALALGRGPSRDSADPGGGTARTSGRDRALSDLLREPLWIHAHPAVEPAQKDRVQLGEELLAERVGDPRARALVPALHAARDLHAPRLGAVRARAGCAAARALGAVIALFVHRVPVLVHVRAQTAHLPPIDARVDMPDPIVDA